MAERSQSSKKGTVDGGRIALFLPSLAGGGAERVALNLAAGFINSGNTVDLVLAKAVGEYLHQVPLGVRVVDLGASRPLTAVPALARYLSSYRPTALLSKITNSNIAALLAIQIARSQTRCVVCEESTFSIDLSYSSKINQLLLPQFIRHYYPRAHAVVAVSQGVADDLIQVTELPHQQIRVIYNPLVSTSLLDLSRQPVSHPWLQKRGIPVIIGMGRLTRQKDFGVLIQAFAKVRKQMPVRLIILGEGEDRSSLNALSRRLGIEAEVDMPGFVVNPYPLLSHSALFVLSSQWEGFGNVLAEALALGVPVVSTDCPNGPREILKGGIYGQLVPTEDPCAMASAMIRVLKGDFVAQNPTEQVSLFDAESNIHRYLDLLVG